MSELNHDALAVISVVGAIFVCLIIWSVIRDRHLLPWVLSAGFAFMGTAGLVIAGQSILVYHLVAIVVILAAMSYSSTATLLVARTDTRVGLRPLIAFGLWSLLITAIVPTLFAGIPVLNPREGIDAGVEEPASLAPQISNFAQSAYLIIALCTVVVLGSNRLLSPWLPTAGFAVGTILSSLREVLPENLAKQLFDNSTTLAYTTGYLNGVERIRGIFSEPSGLGAFSVAGSVFFLMAASRVHGTNRRLALVLSVWALANAYYSGSGGALIGGIAIILVICARATYQYLTGRMLISTGAFVLALAFVPLAAAFGHQIYAGVSSIVGDKVDSDSYNHRSSADTFSFAILRSTWGIGVGVGSNRPSSFLAMIVSCTGVLGLLFFVAALALILKRSNEQVEFQPATWALISLLISKVVSGPDLSDPPMWLLLAVCASAAWRDSGQRDTRRSAQPKQLSGRHCSSETVVSRPVRHGDTRYSYSRSLSNG